MVRTQHLPPQNPRSDVISLGRAYWRQERSENRRLSLRWFEPDTATTRGNTPDLYVCGQGLASSRDGCMRLGVAVCGGRAGCVPKIITGSAMPDGWLAKIRRETQRPQRVRRQVQRRA